MQHQLDLLLTPLEGLEPYRALREALKAPGTQGAFGLDDSQRLHMLAGLCRDTGRPLIVVTPSDQSAARCMQDLAALLPGGVMAFPAREVSFLRTAASSRDLNMGRLHALGMAVTGRLSALVVPADALLHRLMPRAVFEKSVIRVREGERRDPISLMEALTAAGYDADRTVGINPGRTWTIVDTEDTLGVNINLKKIMDD